MKYVSFKSGWDVLNFCVVFPPNPYSRTKKNIFILSTRNQDIIIEGSWTCREGLNRVTEPHICNPLLLDYD